MAPRVQVPMDFGVKYLGSPSHGNLKFRLQEGGEIPANSMIISYNSPVIESLTTDLMQTSIDVDDFSKDAVQCFLESCYSGDLRKITKSNFRDANKMSNVFKVSWLMKRCYGFFEKLVDELNTRSFEDNCYLFEEAMYTWASLKNKNFVEIVIKKFSYEIVKCDQFFVPRYLNNLSCRTANELDVVIEMVGEQKQVLMKVLIEDIGKNSECISANCRYLLKNMRYTASNANHYNGVLHEKLVSMLDAIKSPSKEDFELILSLFKQFDNSSPNCLQKIQNTPKCITIPNCRFLKFRHIRDFPSLTQLMEFLVTFPLVDNSYIFFDAIYCWTFEKFSDSRLYAIIEDTSFTENFIKVILERRWKPLVPEYLKGKNTKIPCLKQLTKKLNEIPAFTSYKNYSRSLSVDDYSPREFFQQDKDVKFYFKHPNKEKCDDGEKCGFILRVTGLFENVDDSFDIQVVIDPKSYPSDIRFHDQCINVANMHIALQIDKYKNYDFPISWSGKPSRDGSKKHFMWGQHLFFSDNEGTIPENSDYRYFWQHASNVRIRLVVYHFN